MPRILLVDDTPEIAELLTFALRDRGYDVYATGFTTEIVELAARESAEAAILDCSEFSMSESLFDTLRGDPALASLPVVLITDTPEIADRSLRRRSARHVLLLPKPFTAGHVAMALDRLLAPGP